MVAKYVKQTKHGMTGSKIHRCWKHMIERCFCVTDPRYSSYGGRGIGICDRWLTFENFFSDMGEIPEGMSRDRVDNNAGYSPENCRWSDRKEQQRNRRNTSYISIDGITKTRMQWCAEFGVNPKTASEWCRRYQPNEVSERFKNQRLTSS